MKDKFKKWLGLDQPEQIDRLDIHHAAAALLVEIMAADNQWDDVEAAEIKRLLTTHLEIDANDAEEMLTEACEKQKNAHDLYQFTSVVNEQYDNAQKFQLLKLLWLVALADGRVDRYEEHMIRKLADLLHLAHSQFIRAKIEARDSFEQTQARTEIR